MGTILTAKGSGKDFLPSMDRLVKVLEQEAYTAPDGCRGSVEKEIIGNDKKVSCCGQKMARIQRTITYDGCVCSDHLGKSGEPKDIIFGCAVCGATKTEGHERIKPLSLASIVLPTAKILPPALDDEERKVYTELAANIGFSPSDLLGERLRAFFKDNNIGVYTNGDMYRYMEDRKHILGGRWKWRPLSQKDSGKVPISHATTGYAGYPHEEFDGAVSKNCHGSAIPIRVLERVKKMKDAFPDDELIFLAGSLPHDSRRPDGFLGVTAVGMRMFIVDYWKDSCFFEKE